MKKVMSLVVAIIVWSVMMVSAFASTAGEAGVSADDALKKLTEGNKRFVTGKFAHLNIGADRRAQLTKGQHPFAVVVSCSDSRVPPEIVFDQGLGDLFVIRTAGEDVDDVVVGSVEYAVEHLGANLVVVLGHQDCGAVKATVAGGEAPGKIPAVVELIKPAVAQAKLQQGDLVDNAVKANIDDQVNILKTSPILAELMEKGKVKVVGAYYNLSAGTVSYR